MRRSADEIEIAMKEIVMSGLPGRTEVLVVGAGPVGLAVAALAHRLTRMATAPSAVRPLRNLALRLLALVPAFRRRLVEQLSGIGHR